MVERLQVGVPTGTVGAGEFSSPRSTFCGDSYFGIHSNSVFTVIYKDSSHSAKSTGDRLQLNT